MTDASVPEVTYNVVRSISVPAAWFLGAHGDPVAEFDHLHLDLIADGTVRWRSDRPALNAPSEEVGRG